MKPAHYEMVSQAARQVEACLGLVQQKNKREANIDAAISRLNRLREELAELESKTDDTPIALIGITGKALDSLESAGIDTVAKYRATSEQKLLSLPNFGPLWLIETRECLRVYDEWNQEDDEVENIPLTIFKPS
jgi:DNA-directed RNA polymerase alpha subunit